MIGQALERRRVFPLHLAVPLVWMVSAGVEAISQIERRPLYLHIDKAREITAGSWICSSRAARDDFGFQVGAPLGRSPASNHRVVSPRRVAVEHSQVACTDCLTPHAHC